MPDDPDIPDDRGLPSNLTGYISKDNGMEIVGGTIEIVAYEILADDGKMCLLSTTDEQEFVDTCFTLHGSYILRLRTSSPVSYSGAVCLQ